MNINDDIIMMPVPRSQFVAVCALLGGASLAAISVAAPRGSTAAENGSRVSPQPDEDPDNPDQRPSVEHEIDAAERADNAELDAAGWPWSEELHASTKGTTKDGLWRMKVGVSRPAAKPGFPKEAQAPSTGGTGTSSAGTTQSGSDTAASPAAGEDEDEFAAFRAAADRANAGDAAAAGAVPARKWTDADLGALCNQAAVKLGDPDPVKKLIAGAVPEGQVPHSRNIPEEGRAVFAAAVEKTAGIEFAG